MRLSKKAKYGIRSLICLARRDHGGSMLAATIAREEKIPRKYLELILLEFKNAGLLISKPGKGGGYRLKRPASEITQSQILLLMEGSMAPVSCLGQTPPGICDDCPGEQKCVIREVMGKAHEIFIKTLDRITLEFMVHEFHRLNTTGADFEVRI